jgi:hypothetical protein
VRRSWREGELQEEGDGNAPDDDQGWTKANPSGKGKERAIDPDMDNSGGTHSFGVFALHDLRAGEEVVLAWEWDDGNAVHSLPVRLKTPANTSDVPVSFSYFILLFLSHVYPHSSPRPSVPNLNANLVYAPNFTSTSTSTPKPKPDIRLGPT